MDKSSERIAIKIEQSFGYFFVSKFTARELLAISYSEPLRKEKEGYFGNQRLLNEDRRQEIVKYINSINCAVPNSIILAANFPPEKGGQLEDNDDLRWRVKLPDEKEDAYKLVIPDLSRKMAIIIDGQHRVFAFEDVFEDRKDTELICSIYLDLPNSLQAFLFATINSTQKPVPKNIAYELFGFDLTNEAPETWSPDKLAISLCRKLNEDDSSPFAGYIKPGALIIEESVDSWQVSTACIVDCILRLISSKPTDDKSLLFKDGISKENKRSRKLLENQRRDSSPLRELYIKGKDGVIYRIIINFFKAAEEVFKLFSGKKQTALSKTIGIQALFDVLRFYILDQKKMKSLDKIDFTQEKFERILRSSKEEDFGKDFFMKFSGVGRSRVRDVILVNSELKKIADIKSDETKEWLSH